MKNALSLISILLLGLPLAEGQFISEVLDYRPAPGQFVNEAPWGVPSSAGSLVGGMGGTLSLGAFGGSVVFRFEKAVENHPENPYGMDFTIFGNPLPDWCEPAAVWVMKDENENGQPDDTWYELAGSDYWFSTTQQGARVRYVNPGGAEALDVPWYLTGGNSGAIRANEVHQQAYYPHPDSFAFLPADTLELDGTLIRGRVDVDHPPLIKSHHRAFGYADNRPRGSGDPTIPDNPYTPETEGAGGDAFDIGWAVDSLGQPVSLDSVHFFRVQTALLHEGGYLGEVSTEIAGAVDVAPQANISGRIELLVLEDLPPEIAPGEYELKAHYFEQGLPGEVPELFWSCDQDWASISPAGLLRVEGEGSLEISVTPTGRPELEFRMQVQVAQEPVEPTGTGPAGNTGEFRFYPNPAKETLVVEGASTPELKIYSLDGRLVRSWIAMEGRNRLDLGGLAPGIYLLGTQKLVIR